MDILIKYKIKSKKDMASKAQVSLANRMLSIIKSDGAINKFDLMDRVDISVSTYNQLSGWFQHRFVDQMKQIEYDKKTKVWKWCEIVQIS